MEKWLYLISPPQIKDDFSQALDHAISQYPQIFYAFQLRLKTKNHNREQKDYIIFWARKLKPVLKKYHIPFIINDEVEIARDIQADGVHLGVSDMPIHKARALLKSDYLIGASAYDCHAKALQAQKDGADYIAFGAFFPTQTKKNTKHASLDLLRQWQKSSSPPICAIGGIGVDEVRPLIKAGADMVAISSAIWAHHQSPRQAIAMIYDKMIG